MGLKRFDSACGMVSSLDFIFVQGETLRGVKVEANVS